MSRRKSMSHFPFNHVVLEDRKEVWIKGGYPGCMGVPTLMKQFFPGYTSHLAKNEFIEELKINPEARNKLDD
tara:strand:- start:2361 stop:2576 length:216 start_codon:yes stop_codon:yes gene_type:complete